MSYDFDIPSFIPDISLYIAYLKQILEMIAALFSNLFSIKEEESTEAAPEGAEG